mmetsp:Transcript_34864/g.86987  ORF Transcript_34864/g.86987 Transcript_34864/m.86987 type:complete len:203 (-) Transcript_34864:862-1470(-)
MVSAGPVSACCPRARSSCALFTVTIMPDPNSTETMKTISQLSTVEHIWPMVASTTTARTGPSNTCHLNVPASAAATGLLSCGLAGALEESGRSSRAVRSSPAGALGKLLWPGSRSRSRAKTDERGGPSAAGAEKESAMGSPRSLHAASALTTACERVSASGDSQHSTNTQASAARCVWPDESCGIGKRAEALITMSIPATLQ